jgi:hypothetical protein
MIASPNYVRGVWDGHGLIRQPKYKDLAESAGVIQDVFVKYFSSRELHTVPFEFNGRSGNSLFLFTKLPIV